MFGRKLTAKFNALAVSASDTALFFTLLELPCALRATSSSALSAATSAVCLHSDNQQPSTICLLSCLFICTTASPNVRQVHVEHEPQHA